MAILLLAVVVIIIFGVALQVEAAPAPAPMPALVQKVAQQFYNLTGLTPLSGVGFRYAAVNDVRVGCVSAPNVKRAGYAVGITVDAAQFDYRVDMLGVVTLCHVTVNGRKS